MKIVQKAVIKNGDRFLILKRSPNAAAFPEYWDFPGGKLETNEDPSSGVEREVLEETGLIVKAIKVLGKYDLDILNSGHPTHQFVVFQTIGEIKDPVLSSEHTDFKWSVKDEILQLEIEPYMKEYFRENNFI